jgi:2-keto-3-deoxy-6-phosphogluconate aldolase
MNKKEVFAGIERIGMMPSVRIPTAEMALFASEAVYYTGVPVVEITMTVPNAVDTDCSLIRERYTVGTHFAGGGVDTV